MLSSCSFPHPHPNKVFRQLFLCQVSAFAQGVGIFDGCAAAPLAPTGLSQGVQKGARSPRWQYMPVGTEHCPSHQPARRPVAGGAVPALLSEAATAGLWQNRGRPRTKSTLASDHLPTNTLSPPTHLTTWPFSFSLALTCPLAGLSESGSSLGSQAMFSYGASPLHCSPQWGTTPK